MHTVILSPREHHSVRTLEEYRHRYRAAIARKQRRGHRVQIHRVETPLVARINHGSWIVDCECGAGNACDPAWPITFCFGCGAEHDVVFPAAHAEIATVLLHRPKTETRNWFPHETVHELREENRRHGIRGGTR